MNKNIEKIRFEPNSFFKNGHIQTIYLGSVRKVKDLENTEKIEIKTDTGTSIKCDYNKISKYSKKLCILVHGLEGSSKSTYIASLAKKILNINSDTLRINLRGCGGTSQLSNTFYHAGLTVDLKKIIDYSINEMKYEEIIIIGFSLGANMVLKLGGEYKNNFPKELKGICSISPPLELNMSSREILKLSNKMYDKYYLDKLKITYKEKQKFFPEIVDLSILKKIKTLYDFDNLITAPHFNYKNAIDYYSKNSSINFIKDIQIKTLIIQSKDDPIIPPSSTEKAMMIKNENIEYLFTKHGGHVAFVNSEKASKNDIDIHWAENRVVDFCKKILI